MKYWIGPLVIYSAPSRLGPPANVLGLLDLRSNSAFQSNDANGIFLWTRDDVDLGSKYSLLGQGDARTIAVTKPVRDVLSLVIGKQVLGLTLSDCLWSILTTQSDPFGINGPKSLMPTRELNIELVLQGHGKVVDKPFSLQMPEATPVITILQEEYRQVRESVLAGKTSDPQLHQKILDFLGSKFKVGSPQDIFIPADLPKELPVKHSTTLSDNFNRADAAPLGTASGGGTWASYLTDSAGINDMTLETTYSGIHSNEKAFGSAAPSWILSRLESDLSSADHYCQISVTAFGDANNQHGTTVRMTNSATDGTSYWGRIVPVLGNLAQFTKANAKGYPTDIATSGAVTITGLPKILKTTINGSTYTVEWDGAVILTGTDTSISTGLRVGTFNYLPVTNDLFADNFFADDGVIPALSSEVRRMLINMVM